MTEKESILIDNILDSLKKFEMNFNELKAECNSFRVSFNERLDKLIEARTK